MQAGHELGKLKTAIKRFKTGRALAQEVADQTHGETRDRAMRWLTERA